jgi:hypothetical protein
MSDAEWGSNVTTVHYADTATHSVNSANNHFNLSCALGLIQGYRWITDTHAISEVNAFHSNGSPDFDLEKRGSVVADVKRAVTPQTQVVDFRELDV